MMATMIQPRSVLLLLLTLWLPRISAGAAFLVSPPTAPSRCDSFSYCSSSARHAQKKKLSMVDKRRQRAKRLPPRPVTGLPPPMFLSEPTDHAATATSTATSPPSPTVGTTRESSSSATATTTDQQQQDAQAAATQKQAQKLLDSQRESVAMLTLVRERLGALPADEIMAALDDQGYWYTCSNKSQLGGGGGFLQTANRVDQLQQELRTLYESGSMSVDMDRLAAGEYLETLQGGTDQYAVAPRAIEWVVSTTKHLSKVLTKAPDNNNNDGAAAVVLDEGLCMAAARTFDRKAKQAAQGLLTGNVTNDDNIDNTNDKQDQPVGRPFSTVADTTNDTNNKDKDIAQEDQRKISLCYYLVPDNWSYGGDLTFATTGETVAAVRDRLVIWKSDETAYRQEFWNGIDSAPIASCIELHLVEKAA